MKLRSSLTRQLLLLGLAGFVLGAAIVGAPSPVRAGIGNPLKKAKEKATQTIEGTQPAKVETGEVVFDDVVLELTDERIGRIVGAFQAAKAAGTGRPAAVEKLNKATEERGKLWEKNSAAIMELQRKRDDLETCYHDGYQEAQEKKTAEYSQKALSDPAIREKFTRAAQEYNAAAAKGDSVAIAKAQAVLYSETLISSEDSLAVRKKCGPMPPQSPPEVRLAELDKDIAARNEEIRVIDKKVAEAQAKQVQMTGEQFAMASERIQMYLAWKKAASQSKNPPVLRGFTQEEIDAMEKRLEELRAALG